VTGARPAKVLLMAVPGLENLPGTELPAGSFTIDAVENAKLATVLEGRR
jgi:hypothetical protein